MSKLDTIGSIFSTNAYGKLTLLNLLELDAVDIDNWAFKLFSKLSPVICMFSSVIGLVVQYIGTAIVCDNKDKFMETYCWLHGSYNIKGQHDEAFY